MASVSGIKWTKSRSCEINYRITQDGEEFITGWTVATLTRNLFFLLYFFPLNGVTMGFQHIYVFFLLSSFFLYSTAF